MTTSLRVVLVDDEPLARMRLRSLLLQAGMSTNVVVDVMGEFGDAVSAYHALVAWAAQGQVGPHALFLDIAMPGPNGLMLAKQIKSMSGAPLVVFITAHPEHALAAFDLDATDYLTKPIRQERLDATLSRLLRRLKASRQAGAGDASSDEFVLVHDRGALRRVPLKDVFYFKADHKSVLARTAEHNWVLDEALLELEQRWNQRFIRIHRNALVARGAMSKLERREDPASGQETWAVHIGAVDEWLAVSRRQVALVKETMAGSV